MRISDWSSDVCSSDLLVRVVFFRFDLRVRRHAARIVDAGQAALLADRVGRIGIQLLGERVLQRDARDEAAERFFAMHIGDRKSTRELQSLMRISYAVFCLKKKTNKATNETIDN